MSRRGLSNDNQIRVALVNELIKRGVDRASIRHEITLDSRSSDGRADMVLLWRDRLVGIEIKSGRDALDRLTEQRPRYSSRFDKTILVHDERHDVAEINSTSSLWHGWGVLQCKPNIEGGIDFDTSIYFGLDSLILGEISATSHVAPAAMLEMLWADEIRLIDRSKTARYAGIRRLAEAMPVRAIRTAVISALRSRRLNRWEESFWRTFDALTPVPSSNLIEGDK